MGRLLGGNYGTKWGRHTRAISTSNAYSYSTSHRAHSLTHAGGKQTRNELNGSQQGGWSYHRTGTEQSGNILESVGFSSLYSRSVRTGFLATEGHPATQEIDGTKLS